jgi:hypothetical protein
MTELKQLLRILSIEEQARTCLTRAEAQRLIRKGDKAKRKLWHDTEQNYGH